MFTPLANSLTSYTEPEDAACACPGQKLIFTCAIRGGGSTLWSGTAFNCSNSNNEIQLRHTQFTVFGGPSGSCNNHTINATSNGVMDGSYCSQLVVRVSTSLNNKTIQCTHDSDMGPALIGNSTLKFMYGEYYHNVIVTVS